MNIEMAIAIEVAVQAERARNLAILKKHADRCTAHARTYPMGSSSGIAQDLSACNIMMASQEISGTKVAS